MVTYEDGLPVMRLEDLDHLQVLDSLVHSGYVAPTPYDEDDDSDIEGVDTSYPVDEEEPEDFQLNDELEPDDGDEDGGDFEYDAEED